MMRMDKRSPTFLAPGTGFVEDSFSMDGGGEGGASDNASDGEWWGEEDGALITHLLSWEYMEVKQKQTAKSQL